MRHKEKRMQKSEFRFSNPKLVKLNFQLNDCPKIQDAPELGLDISIKTNIDKKSDVEATVELVIEIGEISDSFPFFINLVISAKFKLDDVIEGTAFDKLLEVNAPTLLLSYARPIISSITNNAGMDPLHLPFVKFTSQSQKDAL